MSIYLSKMKKKPDSICDFRSCPVGKILILVALFLNFGIQYVSAKHNWPNEVGSGITTSWHPDGGYIYLKIPVWDDDGSDILTYNAGFSPNAGWLDLQLGTSTYRIYCDGGNGKGNDPKFTRSNGDERADMVGTPKSGDVRYIEIRWYIKNSQLNREVSMSFNGSWWNDGATADQDINGYTTKVTTTAEMPKLTLSSPKFSQDNNKRVPQVSMKWNRSGGTGNIQGKGNINLRKDSSTGEIIASQSASSSSGTFTLNASDIDLSKENKYVITQDFSVNNISLSSTSNTVTLDAYPQASKMEASFDESSRQINVTWSVPGTASSNYVKDNFILEYTYTLNGKPVETSKVSVPYEFGKTSYSYAVDVPENTTGYYTFFLIREETKDKEAWNNVYGKRIEKLEVNTIHLTVTEAHAVLLENGKALIYWSTSGQNWSNGSKFVLTRQNITLTTGEDIEMPKSEVFNKPLESEFTSPEEYARYQELFAGDDQGAYIDDMLQLCSEYRYKLQIKPNTNTYSPLSAVYTPETFIPRDQGDLKSEMSASKGYFTDRVEISWSTEGPAFDNFSVRRRIYDPNAEDNKSFDQIASIPGAATQSYYSVEDKNCVPGVIYEYKVVGLSKCANETIESLTQPQTIGFRSPTGQIIGRVTFEDGQAVEGVDVQISSREDIGGQSVRFKGTDGSYLETDNILAQTGLPYSIQAYVKPDMDNANGIILKKGNYEVGLESGIPYFKVENGGLSAKVAGNEKLSTTRFSHISAVYRQAEAGDTLSLYIYRANAAGVDTLLAYKQKVSLSSVMVQEGKAEIGKDFAGYIDEVRVWDAALTQEDIAGNYNRLLAGNEDNLQAYWRFNESVVSEFYDLSYLGTKYNENHGKIHDAQLDGDVVPEPEQLSFRGVTDKSGNYRIIGIPYSGDGTEYTLTPYYGTHQFSPGEKTIVIGQSSSMFNIDFTDQSSFDLSGIVYYNNSTIPVEGVMFYIDGKVASKSNGEIITSDEKGIFEIQVPVGQHEVKATKQNHTFVNEGKLQNSYGADLDYQDNMANVRFWDDTRVRVIGRIAGGAVQDTIPLGHSLSKNNLGEKVSLQLKLNDDSKGKIYYYKDENTGEERTEEEVTMTHFHPEHKNAVKSDASFITITPDPETGEFVADLIPEQYKISNISVTGYSGLSDANVLDLTNAFNEEKVIYTSEPEDGGVVSENTVKYNKSYKYIHRVQPTLTISQVNGQGKTQFGSADYKMMNLAGGTDLISLYDEDTKTYLMGKPVFEKGKTYKIKIDAYEEYPFYKEPQGGGEPEISDYDRVPVCEGSVSITNGFAGKTNELYTLDENGSVTVAYQTVEPNLSNITKKIEASFDFNSNTIVATPVEGYHIGGVMAGGKDFVTQRPTEAVLVLRDPPGSLSYAYAEEGLTISNSSTVTSGTASNVDMQDDVLLGLELTTSVGVGVETETKTESENSVGVIVSSQADDSKSNTKIETTTLSTHFQTSDDPLYVGRNGDLIVANSTNISYGIENLLSIRPVGPNSGDPIVETGDYCISSKQALSVGKSFGTLLVYPQIFIEQSLLPRIINLRDNILLDKGTTDEYAKTLANQNNEPVYISKIDRESEDFGKSNSDVSTFDGDSYRVIFPDNYDETTARDTIAALNTSIDSWIKILADNEEKKIKAVSYKNFSFQAGAGVEYSEEFVLSEEETKTTTFTVGAGLATELGMKVNGFGFRMTLNETVETTSGSEEGSSEEQMKKIGFVLAEEGDDDYISVDIRKEQGASSGTNFVYYTQGGATACPYEGEETTRYYEPGRHKLSEGTLRIEVPKIDAEMTTISNVPSDKAAVFKLLLSNDSEAQEDVIYTLKMDDASNNTGAKFTIDGVPLSTGRDFVVPYGDILEKTLEVRMGDAYDYEGLNLILASQCQYDPTDFLDDIADTVSLSVHFIPASTEVNIKSPGSNWVLNLNSPQLSDGTYYLPITVDGFDVNFRNFHHIAVQSKPSSSSDSDWQNIMTFYADETLFEEAQESDKAMIEGSSITCNFVGTLDQNYDIRAVSYCSLGNDFVTAESQVVSGVRDLVLPKLFGTPKPASGILGIEDEIRIDFNEALAEGYFTNANFEVTAVKNGSNGDHDVSVDLNGETDYLTTEFDKNMTGKSMTMELWVKPDDLNRAGTIFTQGNTPEVFEVSFTADKRIEVQLGTEKYQSDVLNMSADQWAHVAVVYDNEAGNLKAYYNYELAINKDNVPAYNGIGKIEYGRNVNGANYFAGCMHEARFWDEAYSIADIKSRSLSILSGMESSLVAYFPMDEGKGTLITDKARGNNAIMHGNWSTPDGKAIQLDGATGMVVVNSSEIPVKDDKDFTLEFWFRTDASTKADAALVNNGKADGNERGEKGNKFFVGFENSQLIFRSNGYKEVINGSYMDQNWHHFAVSVNRSSGNAQIFMDGELKNYFRSDSVGAISGTEIYLGGCRWGDAQIPDMTYRDRFFSGQIDEFRMWNSALPQSIISRNTNKKMEGSEMGLIAYYPFEKYIVNTANVKELVYTLEDLVEGKSATTEGIVSETNERAPLKSKGPEQSIKYSFVTSGSAIIINLEEAPEVLEKTIVNVALKDVRDLNGNVDPTVYRWSAYVDRNQLRWGESEVVIDKKQYEEYEFVVPLNNIGGSVKNFTIEGLPSWLTADPMSGEIDPKGTQKITFTINEGTNVGTYEEVIYARGENNVTEPLPISVKVNGERPAWNVNPADYKYNMSVFGKMRFNTVFSTDKEDLLAAFQNGKCIGVANNSYDRDHDMWYTFLTVYNNEKQSGDIEFRMWDASTGKTYLATPTPERTITFVNDGVVGTAKDPIVFDGKEIFFQNLSLVKGWNWISFNLSNSNLPNVSAMLMNGSWTTSDVVKSRDYFDSYSRTKGWTGSLTKNGGFDNVSLFMLHSSDDQILSTDGAMIDPKTMPITVLGGRWNYIGYLPSSNITVKEALAGYDAKEGDIIKSQSQFAMYSGTGWIGNLKYMEQNKGYMLLRTASDDVAFTYPSTSGSLSNKSILRKNRRSADENVQETYVNNNYAENMSIVAISEDVESGDKILAYVDGVLRGVSDCVGVNDKQLNFISVSGESGDRDVTFELERNGDVVARAKTTFAYRSNAVIGTLDQPAVIDFSAPEDNISVYPNPFTDKLNIYVKAKADDVVEVAVYDVMGRKVMQWAKETLKSDFYHITWDGITNSDACAPGIYLVRITLNGETVVRKVEKQ